MDCVFCKIVRKELPAQIVYENEDCLAFLDTNPVSRGHTLIIPKRHYELLPHIPEMEFLKYMKTVQKVIQGLLCYTEGVNVLQNNGIDAGQLVPHVHVHLIPRRPKDDVRIGEWRTFVDMDIDKVQKTIQSLLKD